MGGWVIVMEQADYERWLNDQSSSGATMEASGEAIFQERGCGNCHVADGSGKGPSLVGLFGHPAHLAAGQTVNVDEPYLREAILNPNPQNVAGYAPVMPSYQGQLNEEQILDLIAYIRSLGAEGKP
jgi:cytochrome c oxidase subunit II